MTITKLARIFLVTAALFGLSILIATPALAAPRFTFDKDGQANVTIPKDGTVSVNVLIDVESQQTTGGDAVIIYSASDIDIASVANGGFFTDFAFANVPTSGRLEIHGNLSSLYATKTGNGIFASLNIRSKRDSGGGTVTFHCTGEDASSRITKPDFANILSCASVNQLALSYTGSGGVESPTPSPTQPAGEPTATLAPTAAPGQNPTCNFLAVDTNIGQAPLTVSLICAGSDPEDDIWAAEFDFGNGDKQEFVKNVTKSGSFTVAYVYGTSGTYYPSCRVRDIGYHYSDPRDECRRIIAVTGSSTGIGGTDVGGVKPTPAPTKKPTPIPTRKGTPAPEQVQLVEYTSPTPIPTPVAFASTDKTKSFDLPRMFLGLAIIVAALAVGGYLIYKNRKEDNPPNIPIAQD